MLKGCVSFAQVLSVNQNLMKEIAASEIVVYLAIKMDKFKIIVFLNMAFNQTTHILEWWLGKSSL